MINCGSIQKRQTIGIAKARYLDELNVAKILRDTPWIANMKKIISQAIARVSARRSDGSTVTGSAFLVTQRHLLTAFHLIGDRIASQESGPVLYNELIVSFPVSGSSIPGRVADGCFDPHSDWALIELDAPVEGVRPIPLGTVSSGEIDKLKLLGRPLDFESWGFPALARISGSGLTIDGRMQDQDAYYQGAWVYQLYSDNAAAALGDTLNGLSGAPCLIDGAAVGIIRSNLIAPSGAPPVTAAHIAGGVLYACPLATETLQERCAEYLPALDPIRGLPGLPYQPLPLEPFRYLCWYGAEHAEVFFGRNRRLRDLYFQVTDSDTPPVLLIYGASGTGKSSLLEAGLLPRLSQNYEVRAQRREATKTLTQSFDEQISSASSAARRNAKPVIVLLDQIDEVFLDERADANAEVTQFASRMLALTTNSEVKPKIILCFRSEWLANIRSRLIEANVPLSEFYLERLTQHEIEEAVSGIVSTHRLQKYYGVTVDEALPQRIAVDLLADPKSPIAPLLSIILTRLWNEARARRAGEQRMSREAYDRSMRNRLDLDRFLNEQINLVASTRQADVSSGLVADLLYRHTTDYATAKELSWNELCELYHHLVKDGESEYLQGLLRALNKHSLLVTVDDIELNPAQATQQITRLVHDTLATPIRKNYQKSELPGQRAERRLISRIEDWQSSQPDSNTLDRDSLALIDRGTLGMRGMTRDEVNFIKASVLAGRSASRRSLRNIGTVVLAALFIAATASYFGTSSVWRAHTELARSLGGVGIARFLTSEGLRIITHGERIPTTVWDGTRGRKIHDYEGEKLGASYPYWVSKYMYVENDSQYTKFTILNVETGDAKELTHLGGDKWSVDDKLLLVLDESRNEKGEVESLGLSVFDLAKAQFIKRIAPLHATTEVHVIDSDRLLLIGGEGHPANIWSISQERVVAQLKDAKGWTIRPIAIGVESRTKRVATVELHSDAESDQGDVKNSGDDSQEDPQILPDEAGAGTGKFHLRIWDLATTEPLVIAQTSINSADVLSQLIEPFPEGEFKYRATVALSGSMVFASIRVKRDMWDFALFVLDAKLDLLDTRFKPLKVVPVPSMDAFSKRAFLSIAKHGELILWDNLGERITLPNFFGSTSEFKSPTTNRNGDMLLVQRENSRFELWKLDKGLGRTVSSMQGANLRQPLFTVEETAVTAWQEGGQLGFWTLTGEHMGLISGIAGVGSPTVHWNAKECEAIVWMADGRVQKFVYEWDVLGLFRLKKGDCTSSSVNM